MSDNSKTTTENSRVGGTVPLIDIFYRTLHYWPWVLLSVFICVGVGYVHLLRTPKVYMQSAALLIKDDSKGKSAGNVAGDFSRLGLISNKTNIENEMIAMKSPDLMEEVVKRLSLDMNYYIPGRFHNTVAYGESLPVKVSIPQYPDNGAVSFKLTVDGSGKVAISDFNASVAPEDKEQKYVGSLNDTIRTVAGPLVVSPSSSYQKGKKVELLVSKSPMSGTVSSYCGRLGVIKKDENSTIIDLTFTDQNIQRADDVLSTVIGVYNENWIRDKNQIAVSTSNFINERLNVIESELGNVDSDISSFKSANLVPDVGAAASMYMGQSQQLDQQILALNNQLQMTRYVRSYLTADGNDDKILPTNSGVEDLNISGQISEYNAKLLERNNLVSKSSEKNPIVQNMDKELMEMRGAIIGTVDNSIIGIQTKIRSLQGAYGTATSKLASNPTQAKYLLSVERQQKVKESLYLFLLQKREDNELNQAFTAYNTRVIRKPGGSTSPISPNSRNIMMICFAIGLALPFGVVYLKEITNTKVRGRKDVENLSMPMLGEIPQYTEPGKKKSKNFESHSILVQHGSRNIINEAFRVVRTNIEFSRINKEGCNVLAFTSFNPGSGKSFLTINLGAALAIKRKRVLVIDGDMRHGSASAYVGNPEEGLSDYLSGQQNDVYRLLVTPEGLPSMQVLPIGTVPPNPTELLESPRFGSLIESLREDYDYILIDCPPIEVVADAQIIDQYADRTVFVIRAGLLERNMLPEFERMYDEKKYSHMVFILNGTRNDQGRYGYSHAYKYGYGYGYGYGYNYGTNKDRKKA